ncbi:MAG: TerB family tellurite resistance protein [Nitrospinaceae bacterium]|nr:TerB family tellurite resistance protein [Nitrospinaceae bacterium]
MSYLKKLTFLKVLTTIAWADGEVTQSELNILKSFYRKFNLDKDELSELKYYLAAPVSKKEQDELYCQLIAELSSPKEKEEILNALETMVQADKRTGGGEKDLVERFQDFLNKSSPTRRSLGRMRNLLHKTIFAHARDKDPELEKYFKRTVLKKIELKTARQGIKVEVPYDKIYFICLFGTLLATVAHVDGHFDETEQKALKKVLSDHFSFTDKELKVLFEVVAEQAQGGFDFHEVTAEINRLVTYNERLKMTDCLFAIAAADGELSHDEAEEIRRITKSLRIPHKAYIDSKMKTLTRLR